MYGHSGLSLANNNRLTANTSREYTGVTVGRRTAPGRQPQRSDLVLCIHTTPPGGGRWIPWAAGVARRLRLAARRDSRDSVVAREQRATAAAAAHCAAPGVPVLTPKGRRVQLSITALSSDECPCMSSRRCTRS